MQVFSLNVSVDRNKKERTNCEMKQKINFQGLSAFLDFHDSKEQKLRRATICDQSVFTRMKSSQLKVEQALPISALLSLGVSSSCAQLFYSHWIQSRRHGKEIWRDGCGQEWQAVDGRSLGWNENDEDSDRTASWGPRHWTAAQGIRGRWWQHRPGTLRHSALQIEAVQAPTQEELILKCQKKIDTVSLFFTWKHSQWSVHCVQPIITI